MEAETVGRKRYVESYLEYFIYEPEKESPTPNGALGDKIIEIDEIN